MNFKGYKRCNYLNTKAVARLGVYMILLLIIFPNYSAARSFLDSVSKDGNHFLVKNESGRNIDIAEQKGKVLFLNFWALSCVPCKAEMPSIDSLSKYYKNDTNVLVMPVDLDNDFSASPAYFRARGFQLLVYYAASPVPEAFFHGQIPTTVIIDKKGNIAWYSEGENDFTSKKFLDLVTKLNKEP